MVSLDYIFELSGKILADRDIWHFV